MAFRHFLSKQIHENLIFIGYLIEFDYTATLGIEWHQSTFVNRADFHVSELLDSEIRCKPAH